MAPPSYSDLGKQARDIFSKNYHFGIVKLDIKTKTSKNLEFAVNGVSDNDTGRVNAQLETKYLYNKYGCTLKKKWTTDNTILSELSFEDQLIKGSKVTLNASIAPQSGKKSGALKTVLKGDNVHFNADFDFDSLNNGTLIHSAIVLGQQGFLVGGKLSVNPHQVKLNKINFSLGYQDKEFQIHTNVCDGKEYLGSIYQKINKNLDGALSLSYSASSNTSVFSVGCLYKLDPNTQIKARVNNNSVLGLGLITTLKPGISLTLNALIDGKNFNQGGHKFGLGLDLQP